MQPTDGLLRTCVHWPPLVVLCTAYLTRLPDTSPRTLRLAHDHLISNRNSTFVFSLIIFQLAFSPLQRSIPVCTIHFTIHRRTTSHVVASLPDDRCAFEFPNG